MKTLKLQVGKTYRSREGEEVKIVGMGNKGWDYWEGSNGEWYYEGGKWSYVTKEHPKDLIEEVPEPRHTFDIPDGVKKITVSQVGNCIVVEMVPGKGPNPGDVSSRFFIPESAQQWLLNGDRGVSSETIFGAITGLYINRSKYPPADPPDFYRCYKLIKAVPEWKEELYKVAELSNTWKNVVDNWDKLSELLEEQIEWRDKGISESNGMYYFMKQLGC